jgi:hypothetical protein
MLVIAPLSRASAEGRTRSHRDRLFDRLIQPAQFAAIRKVKLWSFPLGRRGFARRARAWDAFKASQSRSSCRCSGLAAQSARPRVYVVVRQRGEDVLRPVSAGASDDETIERLPCLAARGRLFFANANWVGDRIRKLVADTNPAL